MAEIMEHRGPDGSGMWVNDEGTVGFAHLRLAIIDLAEGAAQPMHGYGGTTITYNGEIYNHIEVRHDLKKIGRAHV